MMKKYLILLIVLVGFTIRAQTATVDENLFTGKNIVGIEEIVAELKNPQVQWRLEANKRIDKYRKAQLLLTVIDRQTRRPLKNATVTVKMLQHQFRFGGVIKATDYRKNVVAYQAAYKQFAFNAAGFCNALKYKLRRGAERSKPEEIIKWLRGMNIYLRGHCLIWPGTKHLPKELAILVKNYDGSEQQRQQIRQLCNNIVSAWAKKWDVNEWDVINEPRANNIIQHILGEKVEAEWFKVAQRNLRHQGGLLYLNENRVISDPGRIYNNSKKNKKKSRRLQNEVKSTKVMTYYKNVKRLLEHGAPLSGLGFQSRYGSLLSPEIINQRLALFSEFKLPIAATEFEMKPSLGSEFDKAKMTERVMTIYFSYPLVNGIYSWSFIATGRGLIDKDYMPTACGKMWLYLTKQHWNSDQSTVTTSNGKVALQLFKGRYSITVTVGKIEKQQLVLLTKNQFITLEI